ncbi:MAG: hypothetical protein LJE67_11680 [Salaquimonas sp.]|nr:hypothetical protein [Salaquimonas sp.]
MNTRILLLAASFAAIAGLAHADSVPFFLANGQKYVTDTKICSGKDTDETDALQLTAKGMFGYEFGCNFLQFLDVKDSGDGSVYQYLAIAACGDDSGISRGDMITLTPSGDDQLRVTSQNDYVVELSQGGDDDTQGSWIVEKEFTRCLN